MVGSRPAPSCVAGAGRAGRRCRPTAMSSSTAWWASPACGVTLAALEAGHAAGPGQQGVADRRRAGRAAGLGHVRARADPGRQRALRPPPVPAGHDTAAAAVGAQIVLTASGGPFRGRTRADLASGHGRRRAGPPDLVDGPEDHRRLVDADEQGAGGDRGPRAVRRRLRPHRRGGAPAVDRPLDGRVHRRIDDRPALDARHAAAASATRWPTRTASAPPFGAHRLGRARRASTSSRPTVEAFPCLDLAYEAGRAGETAPAWLNAANEVAVEAFLEGRIRWVDIADVLKETLDRHDGTKATSVDVVMEVDRMPRRSARSVVDVIINRT